MPSRENPGLDNPVFPQSGDSSDPYSGSTLNKEIKSEYSKETPTNGILHNKDANVLSKTGENSKAKTKKEKPNVVGISEVVRKTYIMAD